MSDLAEGDAGQPATRDPDIASTVDSVAALREALVLAGRLKAEERAQEAEAIYRQIVELYPEEIAPLNNLALLFQDQGRLDEAERLLRKALSLNPSLPEPYNNLGNVLIARNEYEAAADAFRSALRLRPGYTAALANLGTALSRLGRLNEAVMNYLQALALQPHLAETHNNLGCAQRDLGQLNAAEQSFRRALAIRPDDIEARLNLATVCHLRGEWETAEDILRQVLVDRPDSVKALTGLGVVLLAQDRKDEAEKLLRSAVETQPDFFEALSNLGNVLVAQGRNDEAMEYFHKALSLKPNDAGVLTNIGTVHRMARRFEEAEATLNLALLQNPDSAHTHNALGSLYRDQDQRDKAEWHYRRAIELSPEDDAFHENLAAMYTNMGRFYEAIAMFRGILERGNVRDRRGLAGIYNQLGGALSLGGQLKEALSAFRRAIELDPDNPTLHMSLVFALHYDAEATPEDLRREAVAWGERHAPARLAWPAPANDRDPARRLKVGYVSGDFKTHPVGFWTEAVLAAHDRAAVEVFCYSNLARADALTARIRAAADHWRQVEALSDDGLAGLVRADGIDLLVDLSGHTAGHRLLAFARKPAPVQLTWSGYFDTTGVRAIDYIVADPVLIPPEEERLYVERPLRLPEVYVCLTPPAPAPPVGPPPLLAEGVPTFGSFNNLAKVGPAVVALWAALLRAVPGARLFLKTKALGDPAVVAAVAARFAAEGVGPERLRLEGASPREALLAAYAEVDVALDPFPYGGGTTTAEALWMGVPVVALKRPHFQGHQGETLLNALGLRHLAAPDRAAYVATAAGLVADPAGLAALRAGMRARALASPLFDAARFTRALEAAYRAAWRAWCAEGAVDKT